MTNEARVPTRMGDGTFTRMTRSEIRADLVAGSEAAAKRAKVPPLTDEELEQEWDREAADEEDQEAHRQP